MDNLGQIGAGMTTGFFFGSIPFGYLLVRVVARKDVRESGSGNIGATNVGRSLGTPGGVATLALDAAKGGAGVWVAGYLGVGGAEAALGGVLGHCYTPWLGFRGGKGVATLLGGFSVVAVVPTLVAAVVLGGVALGSRMMSLASLCGTVTLTLVAWWLQEPLATVGASAAATVLIVWRHRSNIQRILSGEESRLGKAR